MEILFDDVVYDLENRGLRKLLHRAIEEYVEGREFTDEMLDELELIHELISAKDYSGLIDGYFEHTGISFYEVDDSYILERALRNAGYKVETSKVSRSIYAINDDGIEVRISDHKRPAIVVNGAYVGEHHHEKEIIVKGDTIYLRQLKEAGFSKLNRNEYIFGI